jgi:uncharacterized repeat protein (TIGR03803 family)
MLALFRLSLTLLLLLVLSACGGGAGGGQLNTNATLTTVTVTLNNPSIAKGTDTNATATGTWSDGTSRVIEASGLAWAVSAPSVANIDSNGVLHGLAEGSATITASIDGVAGNVSITVTAATMQSISLTSGVTSDLPRGLSTQFTAQGNFSDGTSQDISSLVIWASSSPSTATINTSVQAVAVAPGTTSISASRNGITQSITLTVSSATMTSLAVTPASISLPIGSNTQLTATATYTDGTSRNVTSTVNWTATGSGSVNSTGLASASTTGTIQVTAAMEGHSGQAIITGTSATLQSISIAPANTSIAKGLSQAFTATGTYSDGTTKNISSAVIWSSSATSVATVATGGLATGAGSGSTTITATSSSITGSTTLTVTAAELKAITITPTTSSIAKGLSQQFTANGTYSDNTTQNISSLVTWSSSTASVATVATGGKATGLATGSTTITAKSGTLTVSATLTVTSATLQSLKIWLTGVNASTNIPKGLTQQLTVEGTYSDRNTSSSMTGVTWSSDTALVATVNDAGLVTSIATGSAKITAMAEGITTSVKVIVISATVQSITITPANNSLGVGQSRSFSATGTFSDGVSRGLSNAIWSSDTASVATIDSTGLATGIALGAANIRATSGNVSGSTTLTVTKISILHSFDGTPSDGAFPVAELVIDGSGNLYGTTPLFSPEISGTVFKIDVASRKSILHTGSFPSSGAGLILRSGNLYGITYRGYGDDFGAIFKIDSNGSVSTIHSFGSEANFSNTDINSLIMDDSGNFYGASRTGGTYGVGMVFKIDANGKESILYNFSGESNHSLSLATSYDGKLPNPGLIMDNDGNFYGTTQEGGGVNSINSQGPSYQGSRGTVFKIAPSGTESILLNIREVGQLPIAGLIMDSASNLYGTTCGVADTGTGLTDPVFGDVVFDMLSNSPSNARVLYSLGTQQSDGQCSRGRLIMDSAGNLYGTTYEGGANGAGTVFKIDTASGYSILHSFGSGTNDGQHPMSGLTIDSTGNLYGTTRDGGEHSYGTVFKIPK